MTIMVRLHTRLYSHTGLIDVRVWSSHTYSVRSKSEQNRNIAISHTEATYFLYLD